MVFKNPLFFIPFMMALGGCSTLQVAPPTESEISGQPFVIQLPKDIDNNNSLLKGAKLKSFTNKKSDPIVTSSFDFFSVNFNEDIKNSILKTNICRGRIVSGTKYKSCVVIDSKVTEIKKGDISEIRIQPFKKTSIQGRNALFLPIDLPKVDLDKLYFWMSYQFVQIERKYVSDYPSEALKANFDRSLRKSTRTSADAASKQFKDTYDLNLGSDFSGYIGANFYPYKNGSLVNIKIHLIHKSTYNTSLIDWSTIIKKVTSSIEDIINS